MYWRPALIILMFATALSLIHPISRSGIRSASASSYFFLKNWSTNNRNLSSTSTSTSTAAAPSIKSKTFFQPSVDNMATGATEGPLPPPLSTTTTTTTPATQSTEALTSLPKLSHAEFQTYNKLAVMMEYYHNNFRRTWTTIYTACERNKRPQGMSIAQFLRLGTDFIRHLTAHHTIEERYIFPILAAKMPEFRTGADMLTQHAGIHAGLDRLEEYLGQVRRGERELRLSSSDQGEESLKDVLDSFGDVLWEHLDQEVRNLGAENMRKYWTAKDMAGFNF